jgi:biopolymer transport protein ExbD
MKRRPSSQPEIPLTSTSDVAFLLLIFFLVAASTGTDRGRKLDLPSTEKTTEPIKEATNLEITVGAETLKAGETELADIDELKAVVRDHLADRTEPSERVVMVNTAEEVTYQRWSDVFVAIETSGGIPVPQIEEGESGPSQE